MKLESIQFSFWFLQTLAMCLTCLIVPKLKVDGPIAALVTVVVLAFVNAHLWDTALFFQVPDNLSLKTFLLVLSNGVVFWLVVKLLPGISIEGVLPAIIAPVIFTISNLLIERYGKEVDWVAVGKEIMHVFKTVREYFANDSKAHSFLINLSPFFNRA